MFRPVLDCCFCGYTGLVRVSCITGRVIVVKGGRERGKRGGNGGGGEGGCWMVMCLGKT